MTLANGYDFISISCATFHRVAEYKINTCHTAILGSEAKCALGQRRERKMRHALIFFIKTCKILFQEHTTIKKTAYLRVNLM